MGACVGACRAHAWTTVCRLATCGNVVCERPVRARGSHVAHALADAPFGRDRRSASLRTVGEVLRAVRDDAPAVVAAREARGQAAVVVAEPEVAERLLRRDGERAEGGAVEA